MNRYAGVVDQGYVNVAHPTPKPRPLKGRGGRGERAALKKDVDMAWLLQSPIHAGLDTDTSCL
jgi:hypothetical protein